MSEFPSTTTKQTSETAEVSQRPWIGQPYSTPTVRAGRLVLNVDTLRLLRHQHCLSQEDLADECRQRGISISVASVKRAEAGKPVIFRTARGLARFFSVTVERLFP